MIMLTLTILLRLAAKTARKDIDPSWIENSVTTLLNILKEVKYIRNVKTHAHKVFETMSEYTKEKGKVEDFTKAAAQRASPVSIGRNLGNLSSKWNKMDYQDPNIIH